MGGPLTIRDSPGLTRLRAVDARLDRGPRLSLAPGRARARALEEVVAGLVAEDPAGAPAEVEALACGVARVAEATLDHFPDNLFWDLDGLAAALWRGRRAGDAAPAAVLAERAARLAELQSLFGGATSIRFRYAHDFLFGFDWARWVRAEPVSRGAVGPYDPAFVARMHGRGRELLALVAADDPTYPRLHGPHHRNPFAFSREPDDEVRLHRDLAARGLVPVHAWDPHHAGEWARPFAELRVERSRALGLAR